MLLTLAGICVVLFALVIILIKSIRSADATIAEQKAKILDLESKYAIINKQSEISNRPVTTDAAYDKLFSETNN